MKFAIARSSPELWLALGLAACVLAAPVLVTELLRADHARAYRGLCGPYATDIPAHACSFAQYMQNFNGGFSGLALSLIQIVVLVTSAGVALLIWKVFRRRASA